MRRRVAGEGDPAGIDAEMDHQPRQLDAAAVALQYRHVPAERRQPRLQRPLQPEGAAAAEQQHLRAILLQRRDRGLHCRFQHPAGCAAGEALRLAAQGRPSPMRRARQRVVDVADGSEAMRHPVAHHQLRHMGVVRLRDVDDREAVADVIARCICACALAVTGMRWRRPISRASMKPGSPPPSGTDGIVAAALAGLPHDRQPGDAGDGEFLPRLHRPVAMRRDRTGCRSQSRSASSGATAAWFIRSVSLVPPSSR